MLSAHAKEPTMTPPECWPNRRGFLKMSAAVAVGFSGVPHLAKPDTEESNTIVGPRKGYTPEIGTLTSMMGFMRWQVLASAKGLNQNDLDFLLDDKANTIGALLNHLAATETYYQLNTFEGMKWDTWPDAIKQRWDVSMELGQPARKAIRGNSLDYYLSLLKQAR